LTIEIATGNQYQSINMKVCQYIIYQTKFLHLISYTWW